MRSRLLLCTALLFAGNGLAWAQEGPDATSGEGGVDEARRLSTVTVQSQRREQSILEVPIAVTSYDAAALEAAGIEDILDFSDANPSVSTNSLSDIVTNSPIRIRGFGTSGGNPGFEGAVGMYVDDVFRSRPGAALLTFFDMEGVEILRGPQGTLFGKNTTAGAIVQRTAKPQIGTFAGRVAAEAAEFDTYEFEGMLNLPAGDSAAFRVAGLYRESDGFITQAVTGEPTAPTETVALRGSFAFEATEKLSGHVVLDWSDYENPGATNLATRLDNRDTNGLNNTLYPALALDTSTGGAGYWYWDVSDPANPGPADPFSYTSGVNFLGGGGMEQSGLTVDLKYDISDTLRLRSITGYRDFEGGRDNVDADFGPTSFNGGFTTEYDIRSFSQEFLLNGSSEFANTQALDYTLGVNLFQEDIDYAAITSFGDQLGAFAAIATGIPLPDVLATPDVLLRDSDFTQEETSWGVFAHGDYQFTDQWSLIGGVRWNSIEKEATHVNNLGTRAVYAQGIADQGLFLYLANGAALSGPDFTASTEDEELTYDIALQFRPNDDMQLYLKYARGFKAGGFNLATDAIGGRPSISGDFQLPGVVSGVVGPINVELVPCAADDVVTQTTTEVFEDCDTANFAPEFVDAYELAYRWEYGNGRLGVTLFRSEFEDLQVAVFDGQVFNVLNAGTSTSEGIEIENTHVWTDTFSTNFGLTWMNAEYGDDVQGLPAGRQRERSPDLSVVIGGRYEQPITSTLNLYADANYSYFSEQFLAEEDTEPLVSTEQDAYGIASFALGLRGDAGWDAQVYCRNCFEEEYFTWAFNHVFHSGGSPMIYPGAPQVFGVRVRKDF